MLNNGVRYEILDTEGSDFEELVKRENTVASTLRGRDMRIGKDSEKPKERFSRRYTEQALSHLLDKVPNAYSADVNKAVRKLLGTEITDHNEPETSMDEIEQSVILARVAFSRVRQYVDAMAALRKMYLSGDSGRDIYLNKYRTLVTEAEVSLEQLKSQRNKLREKVRKNVAGEEA